MRRVGNENSGLKRFQFLLERHIRFRGLGREAAKPESPKTGNAVAQIVPLGLGQGAQDGVLAGLATALLALFSYALLNPQFGFDDANITQNYAENIAGGFGYVYYIGGERVEGSTSPLWTAYNALLFYLIPRPEMALGASGVAVTFATFLTSIGIARHLHGVAGLSPTAAPYLVTALFLAVPAFTGWTAWSLMDAGLWILLITLLVRSCLRILAGLEKHTWRVVTLAILVALCRPEGLAVSIGCSILLILLGWYLASPKIRWSGLVSGLASLTAVSLLIAARLWYFGYPHPNTFYAKVSTELGPQILDGLRYLKSYLTEPIHILLYALAAISLLQLWRLKDQWHAQRTLLASSAFIALFVVGGIAVYVVLGGDHFGSHRFFQPFLPLLIPAASLALTLALAAAPLGRKASLATLLCLGAGTIAYQWMDFARHKGGYAVEFEIAELGRDMGNRLNALPDRPMVGIYIAGGIAMTYEGTIYDLLGLNWVAMAHEERDHVGRYTNHGGFARAVFFQTLPDIVNPAREACAHEDWTQNSFAANILDGLYDDPEFNELYVPDCWNGLRFFRKRTYSLPS